MSSFRSNRPDQTPNPPGSSAPAPSITVEFIGLAESRAGVASATFRAHVLGELTAALCRRFPAFCGSDSKLAGQPGPAWTMNINGDRFVDDMDTPLNDNDVVLLMSLDAGG